MKKSPQKTRKSSAQSRKKPASPRRKLPRPARKRASVEAPGPDTRKYADLPIKRILVPIDFSGHAKNALKYAIPLAETHGASIHLVYVIEPTIYPADFGFGQVVMPGVEQELRVKGEVELEMLMEREIGSRVPSSYAVRMGKAHQEILQEADEKKIDLIVIATHGHTGVEQILFGSTAMRVVRLSKCPVMTVRPPED